MLERAVGPLSEAPPAVVRSAAPKSARPGPRSVAPPSARESERPRRRSLSGLRRCARFAPSIVPPTGDAFELDVGTLEDLPARSRAATPRGARKTVPPRSRPPQPRPQQQRPSAQFASAP